jgi:hypothetical protein
MAYKGVRWDTRRQRFAASIIVHGTRYHLSYYPFELQAAMAYNQAAVEHFGVDAPLNVPPFLRWSPEDVQTWREQLRREQQRQVWAKLAGTKGHQPEEEDL